MEALEKCVRELGFQETECEGIFTSVMGHDPQHPCEGGRWQEIPLEDLHQELKNLVENYGTARYKKTPYINILRGVKNNGPWEVE